jgi:hypothetical protein
MKCTSLFLNLPLVFPKTWVITMRQRGKGHSTTTFPDLIHRIPQLRILHREAHYNGNHVIYDYINRDLRGRNF